MATYHSEESDMEEKTEQLLVDDTDYETEVPEGYTGKGKEEAAKSGEIRAVIPGVIIEVRVRKDQKVAEGDVVIVLEAMKMYNDIETDSDGTVNEILVAEGDKVAKGQVMIRLA
jgi:biotin carboxyl carrier protein